MQATTGRNDPCPCGSGKKFKNCCMFKMKSPAARLRRPIFFIIVILIGAAVGVTAAIRAIRKPAAAAAAAATNEVPHEIPMPFGDAPDAVQAPQPPAEHEYKPGPQPPGPVPPGKVWSEAHGHWHNVLQNSGAASAPAEQPPGEAPEGKVWSKEHGHWHTEAEEAALAKVRAATDATKDGASPEAAPSGVTPDP